MSFSGQFIKVLVNRRQWLWNKRILDKNPDVNSELIATDWALEIIKASLIHVREPSKESFNDLVIAVRDAKNRQICVSR